jgi:hypothetical protein
MQGTSVSFFPQHPYAIFSAEAASEYIAFGGTIEAQVWYPPACCSLLDAISEQQAIGCNGTGDPLGPYVKT